MNRGTYTSSKTRQILLGLGAALLGLLVTVQLEATDYDINEDNRTSTISNVTVNGVSDGVLLERGNGEESSGNGVYRNILELTGPGQTNNSGIAMGYNYKGAQTQPFHETNSGGFDAYVRMGSLPYVTKGGVDYVGFALDSTERGSDMYISIDEFRIYGYNEPSYPTLTGSHVTSESNLGNLGTLIYSMDNLSAGSGGNDILLNLFSSSSGKADLRIFVPVSYFTSAAGVDVNSTMYMWVKQGARGNVGGLDYGDNGNSEQWSVIGLFADNPNQPTLDSILPVPEPTTILTGAACLFACFFHGWSRWKKNRK